MRPSAPVAVVLGLLAALAAAGSARANGILVDPRDGNPLPRGAAGPVVLASHRVRAVLHDRIADVEVEQVFRNRIGSELEGVYLFPLPDGAAVSRFAMTMGGRLVEGEVLAAEDARAVYESIVSKRRDPGLLEYAGRGLYRARVFPIPASGEVRVRIAFQQVVPEDAGTLEFRYPLASDRLNGGAVAEVDVEVRVESAADVKAVYSPSHAVDVARAGERGATVRWKRSKAATDRDFLLYVGRSPDDVGFSLISQKATGEDGTFVAVLAPRVEPSAPPVPKDVVFVLDTSGSMAGDKIAAARRAVLAGIASLRRGDRFEVLAFATSVVPFRGTLVAADDAQRAAARAWMEDRPAGGGTYLERALLQALALPDTGRLRHVVLVTDGIPTVGETDADVLVRRAAAANPAHARVFTFGVGHELDVTLLDRIAEATGGTRDYVAGGEDLEVATGRFYAKVDRPVMTNVRIEFGSGVYDVFPARVPDLFAGSQVIVFGRYRSPGPRHVRLTGNVGGSSVEVGHDGDLRAEGGPAFLPRLWAQRKIAFLLDEIRLHGADRELVEEVQRLGTRHALVTPYTSGLVVEDSELAAARGHGPAATAGTRPGATGSTRARWRGPSGQVPPGLREPSDPTPPPPPPPSTSPPPMTTPTTPASPPSTPAVSNELRRRMEAASAEDVEAATGTVRTVGSRTFTLRADGAWVEAAYDGKATTRRVTVWSDAYYVLLRASDEVARILALGERVVFLLEGVPYEIVPAGAR